MGISIRGISRKVSKAHKNIEKKGNAKATEDAEHKAKVIAGPKVMTDAEKKDAVDAAGAASRAAADPLLAQAQGISRESFGLGDDGLAQRAAERAALFQQQQSRLTARQGVGQRQAQTEMGRRLGAQGLRGTGTAERLAEVAQRRMALGASGQQQQLGVGQTQMELGAREQERAAIQQIAQFREQSMLQANELATRLESQGMNAEQARIFASEQQTKQNFFQENVVMKMNNDQFKERLGVAMDQFNQNMKQRIAEFDLDEEVTRFNMALSEAEAGKGGMFDGLGSAGTAFWKNTFGRPTGNDSGFALPGFRSASPGVPFGTNTHIPRGRVQTGSSPFLSGGII